MLWKTVYCEILPQQREGEKKKGINPCATGPLLSSSLLQSSRHRWIPISYGTLQHNTAPCHAMPVGTADSWPDKSTTIAGRPNTHQSKYIVLTDWSNLSNPSLQANQWDLCVWAGRVLVLAEHCIWALHRCSAESRVKRRNTNGTTRVEETFLLLISLLTNPTLR